MKISKIVLFFSAVVGYIIGYRIHEHLFSYVDVIYLIPLYVLYIISSVKKMDFNELGQKYEKN